MAYELAVVLPTFNESANVQRLAERLQTALAGVRYEVIFVDDDSPDGTAAAVRRLAAHYDNLRVLHRIGRRGLASACTEGILAASAEFVAVMEPTCSTMKACCRRCCAAFARRTSIWWWARAILPEAAWGSSPAVG
ncbi:MAG: glycosyltransferase [Candidatus Korobacteraceae bacterium]